MSSLIVEVCKINNIEPHPNADRLEIATVKGWNCVIPKYRFKKEDLIIYIPIDSVLPLELSDRMNVTQYLHNGRVKAIKLRKIPSYGLVEPTSILPDNIVPEEGMDVAGILNITKWEPSPYIIQCGEKQNYDPDFAKYVDIENMRNYPNVFQDTDFVSITEKIHGTNARFGWINDKWQVGSHNCNLRENENNLYWQASKLYPLKEILKPGQMLFGEIYGLMGKNGKKIQALAYGKDNINIAFFDLIDNYKYVDVDEFESFCQSNNLPIVPELCRGYWSNKLIELANGQSEINGANHIKEGIVIKSIRETNDYRIGRKILKYISDDYLCGNYEENIEIIH